MLEIRAGKVQDAQALAPLVLLSATQLLPFIFGSRQQALSYLLQASAQEDGQYSASRHFVAVEGEDVIACMSLWHDSMPLAFQQSTVKSLSDFLSASQLSHIISINKRLATLFLAPQTDELCVGHLAVDKAWQGKQVASKLVAHAITQAKAMGKSKLVLDVDMSNQSAIRFYQKWDFMPKHSQEFEPTGQCFLRMQRYIL
ncbi:GNAT family N-acetyltransferase [Glaciecola sp. SC05]|uniref:GNAT family N-acetyltransferase n=1 Tax=Glaciecola sp. SC05 TaxID=1987355 RepID=UPI00352714B3